MPPGCLSVDVFHLGGEPGVFYCIFHQDWEHLGTPVGAGKEVNGWMNRNGFVHVVVCLYNFQEKVREQGVGER